MKVRQVQFQYKGSRDYIHGTDIFNAMVFGYQPGELEGIRFTVHGFVRSSICELYETSSKSEADLIEEACARCQFAHRGEMHYLVLVAGSEREGGRYEYDEDRVVSLMEMNGDELNLVGKSPFSFIETIVAMNKQHLQALFPDVPGKWVFTRVDLAHNVEDRSDLVLRFKHNMNFRLTKSDVLLHGEKVGDIYFSLVKS